MKRAIILASLLASTAALADADEAVREYRRTFNEIVHETDYINKSPLGRNLGDTPANACANHIAKAKSLGVPPDAVFDFMDLGKVLFSEMQTRVCVPYEQAVHRAEAAQMLATTNDGKQCMSEMDRLLKFGIADLEIEVRDVELKLGEAKKKICEPVAKGLPISKEEKEKARDAAAQPYKEAGITGGKLNVCIAHGAELRGPGGVTLAPVKIKRAALLFVLTGPVEGVYTLQRLTFDHDNIQAVSEKTFKAPPVAGDYR